MSCAACRLKLSSTLVNGQINKCKRATAINKNSSGSPKTFLFSAMTAERYLSLPVNTGSEHITCFLIVKTHYHYFSSDWIKMLFRICIKYVNQNEKLMYF